MGKDAGKPKVDREVVRLMLLGGHPNHEIITRLGVSERTYYRRLKELRKQHGPNWPHDGDGPPVTRIQRPLSEKTAADIEADGKLLIDRDDVSVSELRRQARVVLANSLRSSNERIALMAAQAVVKMGDDLPEVLASTEEVSDEEVAARIRARVEELAPKGVRH